MDDKASIVGVDIGKLSEPATKLIEKVSDAIGVWFEPKRIRRKAEAEADAAEMIAMSDLKISELQRRAAQRIARIETRRQANIEAIEARAVLQLQGKTEGTAPSEDWIANFFGECHDISDEMMQEAWATLLADEVTHPGRFSRLSISTLKNMSAVDAQILALLRPLLWELPDRDQTTLILRGYMNADVERFGLRYAAILHLEALGLVTTSVTDITLVLNGPKLRLKYFANIFEYDFPPSMDRFTVGRVVLTQSGSQLIQLCDAAPNEGYRDETLHWIARQAPGTVPFRRVE